MRRFADGVNSCRAECNVQRGGARNGCRALSLMATLAGFRTRIDPVGRWQPGRSERNWQLELAVAEQVLDGASTVSGDEDGGALGALLGVPGLDAAQPRSGDDAEVCGAQHRATNGVAVARVTLDDSARRGQLVDTCGIRC
jgi:hypothetical protein